jgi:hypothetical protein
MAPPSGNESPESQESDLESPDPEFPPAEFVDASKAPGPIVDLIAACVRFVLHKYKIEPDLTPDTMSFVDQYARDSRPGVSALPPALELVGSSIGAYLGEVARKTYGGFWILGAKPQEHRLCMSDVFLSFCPLAMGVESVVMCEVEGWDAGFQVDPALKSQVEARIEAIPHLEEDAYYLPSTRLEVLEALMDFLRAVQETKKELPKRYLPEDYT